MICNAQTYSIQGYILSDSIQSRRHQSPSAGASFETIDSHSFRKYSFITSPPPRMRPIHRSQWNNSSRRSMEMTPGSNHSTKPCRLNSNPDNKFRSSNISVMGSGGSGGRLNCRRFLSQFGWKRSIQIKVLVKLIILSQNSIDSFWFDDVGVCGRGEG